MEEFDTLASYFVSHTVLRVELTLFGGDKQAKKPADENITGVRVSSGQKLAEDLRKWSPETLEIRVQLLQRSLRLLELRLRG